MAGKGGGKSSGGGGGSSGKSSSNSSSGGGGGGKSSSASVPDNSREPTIITGWEHSRYANNGSNYSSERYAYIGKDEDSNEPQWIDYGPKGGR